MAKASRCVGGITAVLLLFSLNRRLCEAGRSPPLSPLCPVPASRSASPAIDDQRAIGRFVNDQRRHSIRRRPEPRCLSMKLDRIGAVAPGSRGPQFSWVNVAKIAHEDVRLRSSSGNRRTAESTDQAPRPGNTTKGHIVDESAGSNIKPNVAFLSISPRSGSPQSAHCSAESRTASTTDVLPSQSTWSPTRASVPSAYTIITRLRRSRTTSFKKPTALRTESGCQTPHSQGMANISLSRVAPRL